MRWTVLSLCLLLGAACGEAPPDGGAPAGAAPKREGRAETRPAAQPPMVIELRRWNQPRELVRIGTRGVSIGPEGEPLAWKFFPEPQRADEAWYFLRHYAPFEMKTPLGQLAFHGRGRVKATPAERRMLLEWARQTSAEAAGARSAAAYGLLLAWHQGGAGTCQDLLLYLTGEAVATACGWDGEIRGRVDPAQIGRFYGWFDRFKPFQSGEAHPQDLRPGTLQTRLIFAGRGDQPAALRQQAEIESYAAAVFAELARRRGGAPAATPPVPMGTDTSLPEATPAAPPIPRLLLPPDAMRPRPQGPVLQLPEKPPAPPKREAAASVTPL